MPEPISRPLIAALLSSVTIIGGHFLNRRTDRAIQFLGAIILLFTLANFGLRYASLIPGYYKIDPEIIRNLYLSLGALLALVWFASVAVTFRDAVSHQAPDQSPRSIATVCGTLCLILAAPILAGTHIWRSMGILLASEAQIQSSRILVSSFNIVRYGSGHGIERAQYAPSGPGVLLGRIEHAELPAAGVEVSLLLNDEYIVDGLKTNAKGEFVANLPEGIWFLNQLQVLGWNKAPDPGAQYVVVTGQEPKFEGATYDRHAVPKGPGLPIEVTADSSTPALHLRLEKKMKLIWPSINGKVADPSSESISWEHVDNAITYLVNILEVTHDSNGFPARSPHMSRVVSNSDELKLSQLPSMAANGSQHEYSVEITAFSEDKSFLTELSGRDAEITFALQGDMMLVDDRAMKLVGENTEHTLESVFATRNQVARIASLIADQEFDAAEHLLEALPGPTEPGQAEALRGYLLAEQGQCKEAAMMFQKAKEIGGVNCVFPSFYKDACAQY